MHRGRSTRLIWHARPLQIAHLSTDPRPARRSHGLGQLPPPAALILLSFIVWNELIYASVECTGNSPRRTLHGRWLLVDEAGQRRERSAVFGQAARGERVPAARVPRDLVHGDRQPRAEDRGERDSRGGLPGEAVAGTVRGDRAQVQERARP